MSVYVPERGYMVGPTLEPGELPWPIGWEWEWGWNPDEPDKRRRAVRIDDGHAHDWELVTIPPHPVTPMMPMMPTERVVRCATCHVPRCGHSTDRDPCMERRHHNGLHITLHGTFEPVGGYLRDEQP